MLEKLLNEKAIILNLQSKTKNKALTEISEYLFKNKYIKDVKVFNEALLKREKQFSTGIGKGIAIPHAQDNTVLKNVVLIAKTKDKIKWDSSDGEPIDIIFSIALNKNEAAIQTDVLQELSKAMLNEEKINNIRKAKTKKEIINNLLKKDIEKNKDVKKTNNKKLVAVTACPTGIAHTFMAAESIEKEAKKLGYDFKVEKQGRSIENKLSQKEIDDADIIILAIDKGIDGLERFNNKKVIKVGTKDAIKDTNKCIENYINGKTEIIKAQANNEISGDLDWNSFKSVYKNLMGGVSRMLPFIVAGGIILGIGFLLDSGVTGGNFGVTRDISRWFSGLGKLGLGIFVPVLGGYVAYSIIGAEGLMPGFIAGLIASGGGLLYGGSAEGWSNLWGGLTPGVDQDTLKAGSGFIGAMVGGYIGAAMVMILRKYIFKNINKNFQGIVSILGIPVLSVLMTGVIMFCAQIPLVYVAYGLKEGITSLHKKSLIWLIGLIVGAMMAFDMGGPVNKAAYATATSLIAQKGAGAAEYQVMGAVMITGMVPPIAIAFAAITYRKKAFSKADIETSYANWLLGAFFITEGAIPFAGKDPKRIIPSIIVGSMTAGLIMGLLKVGVSAPHGGIFVFALLKSYVFDKQSLQIGMGVLFALASIAAGMLSGGIMLGSWKAYDVKRGKLVLS